MAHLKATHGIWGSWLTVLPYRLWDVVNMMSLSLCSRAHTPRRTQPCYVYWVTLFFPVQIFSVFWNGWSWPIAPLPWFSGNGSSMLGELLGCCEEGRVLISPPHKHTLGRAGIRKARWDMWLVWQSLPFVCCRWSCWRDCHGAVLSWLSSWTCWLSASPPLPCWAVTGAPEPRKYPSLCVGRAKPPSASVSPCHLMQVLAMFHPRMWCTTAGRLGMTALPSDTSTRGCGFPVKRAWKGQVASCPGSHNFFLCIYSTGVWKWKAGGWQHLGEKPSSFS